MKGSIKANLLIFLIIAVIAFCMSLSFANMTIQKDNDSYKLISLEDDSFEPSYIDYVPTITPKNTTNTTNTTDSTDTDATTYNDTIEIINDTYNEIEEIYEEG